MILSTNKIHVRHEELIVNPDERLENTAKRRKQNVLQSNPLHSMGLRCQGLLGTPLLTTEGFCRYVNNPLSNTKDCCQMVTPKVVNEIMVHYSLQVTRKSLYPFSFTFCNWAKGTANILCLSHKNKPGYVPG